MAGSAAKLFIQVGADVSNAAKGLSSIDKQLKGLGRTAGSLRNIAIGATAAVIVKRTITGLNSLAQASAGEVAGQVRLQQAIKNTGQAIDASVVGPLEDWISTQEKLTGFADNDIRDALTNLVLETGNLAEAQDRLTIAEDAAAATGQDVVTMAKLIGKADEDSIGQLTKLGLIRGDYAAKTVGGFDEIAAAQQLARNSGLQYAQALKVVQDGGKAGESVMKKYGVATKDMFGDATQGAIDVKGALNELRANVKGSAAAVNDSPAGLWAAARNEMDHFAKDIGQFVLPMWTSFIRFGIRGITGVRRLFSLFSTDISGPKLGTARKVWKAAFGEEMPDALSGIVDWFKKLGGRFGELVDDLNSTDDSSVRGAIKKFLDGVKADFGDAPTFLKLAITGLGFSVGAGIADKVFGNLVDVLGPAVRLITWSASGTGVQSVLGLGMTLAIASLLFGRDDQGIAGQLENGLFAFLSVAAAAQGFQFARGVGGMKWGLATAGAISLAFTAIEVDKALRSGVGFTNKQLGDLLLAASPFILGVTALAGGPLTIAIGATLAVAILGLEFGTPPETPPLTVPTPPGTLPSNIGQPGRGTLPRATPIGTIQIVNGRLQIYTSNGWQDAGPAGGGGGDYSGGGGNRFMAAGGIAMQATRAIVGEAGPEAVIPLDKFDWSQLGGGRGGGGDRAIEINIHGDVYGEDGEARIRRGVARGMRLAAG